MLHSDRVGFIRYYWSATTHAFDSIFVLSAPAGSGQNQSLFSRKKYMSLPLIVSGEIIVAACGGVYERRSFRDLVVGSARKSQENIVRKIEREWKSTDR